MSWVFFIASTGSMLVSQWRVNSASTSELMVNFYKNLNPNKGEPNRTKGTGIKRGNPFNDQRSTLPTSFILGWDSNDWK